MNAFFAKSLFPGHHHNLCTPVSLVAPYAAKTSANILSVELQKKIQCVKLTIVGCQITLEGKFKHFFIAVVVLLLLLLNCRQKNSRLKKGLIPFDVFLDKSTDTFDIENNNNNNNNNNYNWTDSK